MSNPDTRETILSPPVAPTGGEETRTGSLSARAMLWGAWMVATLVGGATGLILTWFVVPFTFSEWLEPVQPQNLPDWPERVQALFWIEIGVISGLMVGLGQSQILPQLMVGRVQHPSRVQWSLLTGLGSAAGLFALLSAELYFFQGSYSFLLLNREFLVTGLLAGLTGGLILGVAQWLCLRRVGPGALMWIPATMIGWALAWLACSAIAGAWKLGYNGAAGPMVIRWSVLIITFELIANAVAGWAILWAHWRAERSNPESF